MSEQHKHSPENFRLALWAEQLTPKERFNLTGRTAFVTGAGGGIGQWLAAGLAAAGARTVITDINRATLHQTYNLLKENGADAHSVQLDLTDTPNVQSHIQDIVALFGLDIVVNCAAINRRMSTVQVTESTYDQIMNVDLKAPFFVAQAAAQSMMQTGGGSIIHVGSINSFQGLPEVGVYGPAKAALEQLTKVQAIEWAEYGIRVNCLAPGFIDTPLTEPLQADNLRASWIRARVPQTRFGHPAELVGMLQLLASDAGSFITGQTFYVDGGFSAGSDWRKGGPAIH